jgi:uncharacterized membrane protein
MPQQPPMAPHHHATTPSVQCQICKKSFRISALAPAELVHPPVVALIQKEHPEWSSQGFICLNDLNHFRGEYFENLISLDRGELSALETQVITSLKAEEELISENLNITFEKQLTLGERIADRVAEFGGSWAFILLFWAILSGWIVLNSVSALARPFDPYPYILLNLVLSCLAAIQAPIIMMSQNRQEARDRLRAEHDYGVNLKAELEIRHLVARIDQLVTHQWQRLLEIQRLQLELLEPRVGKSPKSSQE